MTLLEFIAAICSLICVWLNTQGKPQAWYWAIIGGIMYAWVFLKNNLYGNFLVQIMFCILSFYGLWEWNFNKKTQKNAIDSEIIKYKVIPKNQYLILFLANTLLFLGIYVVFIYFFKLEINIVNILDILSSTGSIVAQYLLTKKYIENWFFWVVVNVLVILMTFLSGLYITLFLYLIFFGLAIHGYFNWKKFKLEK